MRREQWIEEIESAVANSLQRVASGVDPKWSYDPDTWDGVWCEVARLNWILSNIVADHIEDLKANTAI